MPDRKRRQPEAEAPSPEDVERAAAFRTALRRLLVRTEAATGEAGLTPQRYDLLLMIKSSPNGESTVTELCGKLQLRQTAVTELVKRAEEAGLVSRRQSSTDGRVFRLSLTRDAERRLARAYTALSVDRAAFVEAFDELAETFRASSARPPRRPARAARGRG